MSNYVSYEDAQKLMKKISKKVPQGIMIGDSQVGHIMWQMTLHKDYLKLDGTALSAASEDYKELLKFAQDNNLITSDTTDKSLFKYDETTDVLTLPDYIGLVVQGGNTVEEKEAGLPNITGYLPGYDVSYLDKASYPIYPTQFNTGSASGALRYDRIGQANNTTSIVSDNNSNVFNDIHLDASQSNSIYGNSETVQPPAIQLIPQIKYKKSSTMWEKVEIGRFVATAPSHYEREDLFTTNKTTITIKPTWINIDGSGYVLQEEKEIDLTDTDSWDEAQYALPANRAGTDFYIYACKPTSNVEPDFILSANSTVPTGYSANDSRKIGGFHCLCLNVGTISGHTLSDYVAGDILPLSAWDLRHRAISENEGMVWIKEIGKWVDIYLGSWDGSKLVSAYNQVCVTGASAKAMHGIMMAEEYGLVSKELPSYDEFIVAAKGSPEGVQISTGAIPAGAGGHVATSGQRIISNYGLEDCTGVLWQWGKDCPEDYHQVYNSASSYRGSYYATANDYWLTGYNWVDKPVYHPTVDTVKRGSCFGLLRRLFFGGICTGGSFCGSRSVSCNAFGAYLGAAIGGRGFASKRV